MLELDIIYKTIGEHYLTKNSINFLEWCAIKFNVEELLEQEIKKKYTSLPKLFTDLKIKVPSGQAGKQKLLNIVQQHCNLTRPTQKTYEISEPTYLELSDFKDTYGVYRDLFLLLFNNWLHTIRDKEIIVLTREEIAIQMGMLHSYYQLLEGTNTEYIEFIKEIDKSKRLDDLIDEQLAYMSKNSHTKGHYYKVKEIIAEFTNEVKNIPENACTLVRQIFKKEVDDEELLAIYRKACKIHCFPPECENITIMWKIIAPKDSDFIQLPESIKDFIIKILIINKQDKVYRQLILEQAKQRIDFEDRNNEVAIGLRQEHRFAELELDGRTGYYELEDPKLAKVIDGETIPQINPLRQKNGLKLNEMRDEAKARIAGTYISKSKGNTIIPYF